MPTAAFLRLSALLLAAATAAAQDPKQASTRTPAPPPPSPARAPTLLAGPNERHANAVLNAVRPNPLELHAFIARMPKGADLHMHLSGAIYPETLLEDARADLLCVNPATFSLVKNIGATRSIPPQPVCAEGNLRADSAFGSDPQAQRLYDSLVDAFSMRSFVPSSGTSGHDHFFATFARVGALDKRHWGEWLDEVATRAAAQNEQYLEIMNTPVFNHARELGNQIGWPTPPRSTTTPASLIDQDISGTTPAELSKLRDQLLATGLRDEVAADRKEFDDALAARNATEHCGEPSATAACSVKIRFLYQVLRAFPPQQVFAQTLLGFELASADPDVVGINFVQPEDAYMAMSEYTRQMRMLDYLHTVYPKVHISLHAGELAPGLVPPPGLSFHIRGAVDLGHAERIGHGVDVMYEADPKALLREMASRHIMVEINLTSNDVILGVAGNRHSLPEYRNAHVPTALSTDDEGVSRINITHEYARAAVDFGLSYIDLKNMARTSLEHAFLPGRSLWQHPDTFTAINPACGSNKPGAENPTPACTAFLRSSEKAAQQWELEHRYQVFESNLP